MATAARTLRGRVHALEHLLESALAEGGGLVGDLVEARRSIGLATVVGQPVFVAVMEALEATATARGKIIAAHRQLDRMGDALGMDDAQYGDGGKNIFEPTGATEAPVRMSVAA